MNLYELAEKTSEIANVVGASESTWDNMPMKIAFVMNHIDKAASSKDDIELSMEFANIALRILGILFPIWGDDWSASRVDGRTPITKNAKFTTLFTPIEVLLFPVFSHLCKAVEDWRHERKTDVKINLELALLKLWRLADGLNIDLSKMAEKQLEHG